MIETVRPFERQGHYTVFDNAILDELMPKLSHTGWKVLSFILRQTLGWQKNEDAISYSQIQEGTGIKHPATISKAIKELVTEGIVLAIETEGQFNPTRYRINRAYEIATSKNEVGSKNEVATDSKNEVAPTSKNEDTKQRGKKKQTKGRGHPQWSMPEPLQSDGFEDAWVLWYRHKIDQGEPLTQVAGEVLLDKLAEIGEGRAVTAIRHSIAHGWKNIYEPSNNGAGRSEYSEQVNDDAGGFNL